VQLKQNLGHLSKIFVSLYLMLTSQLPAITGFAAAPAAAANSHGFKGAR